MKEIRLVQTQICSKPTLIQPLKPVNGRPNFSSYLLINSSMGSEVLIPRVAKVVFFTGKIVFLPVEAHMTRSMITNNQKQKLSMYS